MSTELETCAAEQLPEIRRFLARGFGLEAGSLFDRPGYLEWKCFEERPDWKGPRSYVLRQNGEIIAYTSICPIAFVHSGQRVSAQHAVDWTSTVPAGGLLLWRSMYAQSDVFFGMNGSPAAKKVMSGLRNFRNMAEQEYRVRILRPIRFASGRLRSHGWREVLRGARNVRRGWEPWAPIPADWRLVPAKRFGAEVDKLAAETRFESFVAPERSAELLNYLLRCPVGEMQGWLLEAGGVARGWVMVNFLGKEARIVELWLNSESAAEWSSLIALTSREAGRRQEVDFVAMTAVAPLLKAASASNHLRVVSQGSVWVHDPKKLLEQYPPINFQAIDGDQAYL